MGRGLALAGFRCTGCSNCCRSLRVPITDADLARLIRASAQPAERVVEWLAPSEVDLSGEPSSFVELDVGRRVMVLAQSATGCRLLVGDRCSVWALRPRTCRIYPIDASFGRRGGVHRLRLFSGGVDCSYALDRRAPLSAIRAEHAAQRAELVRYHERVRAFNRGQRLRKRLHRRALGASEFLGRITSPERAACCPGACGRAYAYR
jgi:Fe-S-cluster containining protein